MEGSIRDHNLLFQQVFENLNPNGWFEMASMEVNTYSDDGTHLMAPNLVEVAKQLHISSRLFGKDMSSISTWKERMEKAGFINVKEEVLMVCDSFCSFDLRSCWPFLAPSKSMVKRSKAERAGEIPPTEHAWGYAPLQLCSIHSHSWLEARADWSTSSRCSQRAQGSIDSSLHESTHRLRTKTRIRQEYISKEKKKVQKQNKCT